MFVQFAGIIQKSYCALHSRVVLHNCNGSKIGGCDVQLEKFSFCSQKLNCQISCLFLNDKRTNVNNHSFVSDHCYLYEESLLHKCTE